MNGITQFLHVRPVLESIQSAAEKSMQASNRAVARIDAFSTEYHEMGRHFKNMGRTLQGKPAETDAKENGKIARVFKGAFKVEGALISVSYTHLRETRIMKYKSKIMWILT